MTFPSLRLPSRVLGALRVWPFAAGAIVIIAAATWMALRAQDQADRARRAQTAVERLNADAEALDAVAAHASITRLLDPDTSNAEVVSRYFRTGASLFARTTADLDQLRAVAPGADTDVLAGDIQRLFQEIIGLRDDAKSGGITAAIRAQQQQILPLIDRLHTELRRVGQQKDDAAATASRRARLSLLASLFGGMLALLALSLALSRQRRRASVDREVRAVERRSEERLRHQAFHDPLTGLANRTLFGQRLDAALADCEENGNDVAVLFLDLDDFKTINDSLGHDAGDELLRIVSQRISSALRHGDLAARQGGDEFAILLCDVSDERAALVVAERLIEALSPELQISGRTLSVRASIGLVVAEPGASADELLRNADIAMYSAKAQAQGGIRVFEPQLHQMAVDRLELGSDLVHAIDGGQLVLDYQPIVELTDERIRGVEALVRWQHPTRGLLGPGQFIGLAEDTGAIVPLGAWVLRHACAEVQGLRTTQPGCAELELSVNVSLKQLRDGDFPERVAMILAETGLPPAALVLELTESLLIEDPETTLGALQRLKALGVRLAVDDFGTGHSVLSYLQELPIDIVKIDKSFVDTVHTSADQAKLVAGIVQLSRSLHMDVVAEGIEEAAQADRLRSLRSRLGQGFLYSRPVSPAAIAALLAPARAASRP